jgi:NIMA (never in mitosis gene a)-related kinase 1/4/5
MHRDLKSSNIMLNTDGTCFLADFNVSKVLKQNFLSTQTGTPYYASPEVWKEKPYDKKSDIWSLGCVFYEAVTLLPPFRAKDMQSLMKKVTTGDYEDIPKNLYSHELTRVIASMLKVNPKERPSCDMILKTTEVVNKIDQLKLKESRNADDGALKPALLATIKMPKDIGNLFKRLPASKYPDIEPVSRPASSEKPKTPEHV